jgi:hypothetical protein
MIVLNKAAEVVSSGLAFGVEKTVQLMDEGAGYAKSRLPAASRPTKVESEVKNAIETAKAYTGNAVEISSFLRMQNWKKLQSRTCIAFVLSKSMRFAYYYFH